MRFTLIDRVLEQTDDRIKAMKTVSLAEEYLADHFPSFAVLPGVMMLEAMVQAGRTLIGERTDGQGASGPWVLAEVRNLRYGNMVRPGQALVVEVTLKGQAKDGGWDLQGVGTVEDSVAVQGKFCLKSVPVA